MKVGTSEVIKRDGDLLTLTESEVFTRRLHPGITRPRQGTSEILARPRNPVTHFFVATSAPVDNERSDRPVEDRL